MKDQDHPFLRPLWRRILLVAFCVCWSAWEIFYNGEQLWIYIALGMTAYATWVFLITYDRKPPKPADSPADDSKE
jgi:hypothetical protein